MREQPVVFSPSKQHKGLSEDYWVKLLPEKAKIVDLGCGYKKYVSPRIGDEVIGLDHNDQTNADVVCNLNNERYPFEDNSIDAVYSSHCLEHLKDRDHAFWEINRILKSGGLAFVKVPHKSFMQAVNYDHLNFWYSGSMNTFANSKWYSRGYPYFEILKIGLKWRNGDSWFVKFVNKVVNISFNISEMYLWYPLGGFVEVQFLIKKPWKN